MVTGPETRSYRDARVVLAAFVMVTAFCLPTPELHAQVRERADGAGIGAGSGSASTDSSASRSSVRGNAWISAGLGAGGERGAGIAVIGSAWYASGPVAIGARISEGAPFEHETDTHEKAALIGLRARSAHAFIVGAVGAGRMGGSHANGEQSGTRTSFPDQSSLALGLEGGFTYHVIGIGLDAFGARTKRISYSGVTLSVQLGYLE